MTWSDDAYRRQQQIDADLRRQERDAFDLAQRQRTDRLHDALLHKDEGRARDVFDIPPPGRGGTPRVPTIGEQFREHSARLLRYLETAAELNPQVRDQWALRVRQLDFDRPDTGLLLIEEVRDSYLRVRRCPPPARDLGRAMPFEMELDRLGVEIQWLVNIFKHLLGR
jgi:hypothetical protein